MPGRSVRLAVPQDAEEAVLQADARRLDGVHPRPEGSEVPHQDLSRTAIVASGYGSDAMDPLGTLGVVGPTRMDYPGTMASVRAVARYVSQRLADG